MFSKHERSSVLWTRLAYLLAVFWLVACLQSAAVTGSPTNLVARQDDDTLPDDPNDVDDPVAAGDPVPTEDKYPSLDECRNNCNVDKDKSLFYSQVGPHEEIPARFASQESLILVRGMLLSMLSYLVLHRPSYGICVMLTLEITESYPAGFTDKRSDSTGYPKFAQRFSQAFSEKTSGIAHVLLPTDGTSLDKRVWTKTEYPILTGSNGACTRIMKVDPGDFSKRCILWDRSDNYDDKVSTRTLRFHVEILPLKCTGAYVKDMVRLWSTRPCEN